MPCADDVMLNYQSTSYHDAAGVRRLFGLRPAPEFAAWPRGIFYGGVPPADNDGRDGLMRGIQGMLEFQSGGGSR